jgi:DNA topoisomerase-2
MKAEKTSSASMEAISTLDEVMDEQDSTGFKPKAGTSRGRAKKLVIESDSEVEVESSSDWDNEKPAEGKNARGVAAGARGAGKKKTAATGTRKAEEGKTRKRGGNEPAKAKGQKLINEVLAPAVSALEIEESPVHAQKVRRMRPSPFNKKSGSVLSRLSDDEADDGSAAASAPAFRPKRASRTAAQYVISDDDDDDNVEGSDVEEDSDFAEEESE